MSSAKESGDSKSTIVKNMPENDEKLKKGGCFGKAEKKTEPATPAAPDVPFSRILSLSPDAYWMMALGSFCSMCSGATFPAFSVVFGTLFNVFFDPTLADDARMARIAQVAWMFFGIGCGAFLFSYLQTALWVIVGEKIVRRLRALYFEKLLRQEVAFYDATQSGMLISRLSADVMLVQAGVSEKLATVIQYAAQILGGVIVAFVYGWKMTLVMVACSPAIALVGAIHARLLAAKSQQGQSGFALANDVASEAITGIRTVYSFVAEETMVGRYLVLLNKAYKQGVKRAHLQGTGLGSTMLFMFSVYALGFWYGGKLVTDREMKAGDVLTVFFAIVMSAMALGQFGQVMPDIARAKGAAAIIFETIDRTPTIDALDGTGKRSGAKQAKKLRGRISFKGVSFAYPQRPETRVIKKFNLEIKPGKTIALVGPSGSGKSTVIQLLERFYDANDGVISVDRTDIRDYDLKWFRTNIGLVSQEPVLFSGTISDNIRFGNLEATDEQVQEAAKMANAHTFISELEDGYNTQVGERGLQLSGGQKQRIAIARAVLKDPAILLLDEATSALDAESEHLVQEALEKLMKGRTTIIVAHRLTTVRNADRICVLKSGELVEQGTHDELLAQKGLYCTLVKRQLNPSNGNDL